MRKPKKKIKEETSESFYFTLLLQTHSDLVARAKKDKTTCAAIYRKLMREFIKLHADKF